MSDAKTRDTGVSLTYINNNYIRSDGTIPVFGSIDMRGNTLYNVSDPVNPQDKNKRLQKFLRNKRIKILLKPVDNLESSHFVLIENEKCIYNSFLFRTENYKALLERGETYPPDIVHFLVNNNKRNVLNVNNSIITLGLLKF